MAEARAWRVLCTQNAAPGCLSPDAKAARAMQSQTAYCANSRVRAQHTAHSTVLSVSDTHKYCSGAAREQSRKSVPINRIFEHLQRREIEMFDAQRGRRLNSVYCARALHRSGNNRQYRDCQPSQCDCRLADERTNTSTCCSRCVCGAGS